MQRLCVFISPITISKQMFRILCKHVTSIHVLNTKPCRLASNFSKNTSPKKKPKIEVKEVKMTAKINENDLNIKVNQMSNWLKSKCDVRVLITLDGSPGSKAQGDEILQFIQANIANLETLQLVKKSSALKCTLRLADSGSNIVEDTKTNQPSAVSMEERKEQLRKEIAAELVDDELIGGKKK